MEGLRENGAEIMECNDRTSGVGKFWRLWQKHKQIKNDYDLMIVGYPSQIVVPLAKFISSKKVVLDALCSLYEGEIISRRFGKFRSFKALKTWLIDFLAYFFADLILVETNAQIDFFVKTFFVSRKKCVRVFTGASDSVFFPDLSVLKRDVFTAIFRGQFLPEAGVETILASAKILESAGVNFLFIGKDFGEKKLTEKATELHLKNVSVVSGFIPFAEMKNLMLSCHVSLGQFAKHSRLERTIPHKAFESLALGLPYVTGRAGGAQDLLTDKENCLMVNPADPQDLADKILELKNNPVLAKKISEAGITLYKNKLTPKILAGQILTEISKRGF
jgi:glycosyltransferase involved in cell wall biosynthesis